VKVLYANKYFFRNGGSEAVMFDNMAYMESVGVEVVHFSMSDPRNLPSPNASSFVTQKDYRSPSIKIALQSAIGFVHSREAVRKISDLIRAERPDILHCHNIYHQLTPSIISAAASLHIPVVLSLHDFKTICPIYTQFRDGAPCTKCAPTRFENVLKHKCGNYSFAKRLMLWSEARYHQAVGSYRHVDRFIAPSRFLRDAVSARFPADRIALIPNGIDLTKLDVASGDRGYVLYSGRITAEKGVETLLRAHAEDGGAWRLILAGTGPQLDEFRRRYSTADFVGFASDEVLGRLIDGAAVVVAPSEMQENCPMSILEAMAHGKALVASRVGGIPELVRHGLNGFLFEVGDQGALLERIHLLLSDSQLRRRLGFAGRKIVEKDYSSAAHGSALLSLYTELTEKRFTQDRGWIDSSARRSDSTKFPRLSRQ
jgi:glycosyltransferase involved in cell wall biosynthesis